MSIIKNGIEAARKNLSVLVEQASRGKASLITKHGKVYAAIVPESYLRRGKRGVGIGALRSTGKGLWGRSPTRTIAKMRDEWR